MLVKYLKRDWNANKGSIKEVDNQTADILIALGKAEPHKEAPKKPAKKKTTKKPKAKEESK